MEFPEKLEKEIERCGKSQVRLSAETGLSQSAISAMTKGTRKPYMKQGLALAKAIGISLDYLADDALDQPPGPTLTEKEQLVLNTIRRLGIEEANYRLASGPRRKEAMELPEEMHDLLDQIVAKVTRPVPKRSRKKA